jgi:hypothetical protein
MYIFNIFRRQEPGGQKGRKEEAIQVQRWGWWVWRLRERERERERERFIAIK